MHNTSAGAGPDHVGFYDVLAGVQVMNKYKEKHKKQNLGYLQVYACRSNTHGTCFVGTPIGVFL